jgi:hypothetical protein
MKRNPVLQTALALALVVAVHTPVRAQPQGTLNAEEAEKTAIWGQGRFPAQIYLSPRIICVRKHIFSTNP